MLAGSLDPALPVELWFSTYLVSSSISLELFIVETFVGSVGKQWLLKISNTIYLVKPYQ